MLTSILYTQLSGFYFFHFAIVGVLVPYWSLYLQALGFSPARTGELLAIMQSTKIVAPNLWGWLGDRSGKHMQIVRWACLAGGVSFIGIYWVEDSYLGLAFTTLLFSFFWNAALPQFEVVTLNHLGKYVHRYSRVRVWGSIGFIAGAVAMGPIVERWGVRTVPAVTLSLFGLLWLNSVWVGDGMLRKNSARFHQSLKQVMQKPLVISFFAVCFLHQVAFAPYYGFFSLHLEALHYSQKAIGLLWGLGVAMEVAMFIVIPRWLPCFTPHQLLWFSLATAAVRWLLIGHFAEYLPLLCLAQALHSIAFGMFHIASIHLIHQFFPGSLQGRGQALYSSVSFGAGNALGTLVSGYLWQDLGATVTFDLAAGLAGLAWWIALRGVRE